MCPPLSPCTPCSSRLFHLYSCPALCWSASCPVSSPSVFPPSPTWEPFWVCCCPDSLVSRECPSPTLGSTLGSGGRRWFRSFLSYSLLLWGSFQPYSVVFSSVVSSVGPGSSFIEHLVLNYSLMLQMFMLPGEFQPSQNRRTSNLSWNLIGAGAVLGMKGCLGHGIFSAQTMTSGTP